LRRLSRRPLYGNKPNLKKEMDSIIGSVVFEFIGASIKWLYYSIKNWLTGETPISFGTIYSGDEKQEFHEQFFLGVSNVFLGLIFTVGVLSLLIFLGL